MLGICSILSCLLLLIDSVGGFFCFNSIPLGAAGVALGIIARGEIRSRDPRGSTALATGGMVCSIIGLCIGVLLALLSIATLAVLIRLGLPSFTRYCTATFIRMVQSDLPALQRMCGESRKRKPSKKLLLQVWRL